MKLSVLIPMYNAESYIANCLESLVNQDIEANDYEIIIMDDGSSDNSVKIVKDYQKSYNNILLHQESNSGSDSTRNKLLKYAKGDYIYFLDADDYIAYNSLKSILEYAEKNELDFIGFDTVLTKKLDEYDLKNCVDNPSELSIITGLKYLEENKGLRHEVWWYLIKRDLILSNGICFDSNGNNSDVIFTVKSILRAKNLVFYPLPIHRYVQTTSSVMRGESADKKRKLIDSMFSMIISYSNLINETERETIKYKKTIIDNLKFRRDVFTFFNIINMIREKYSKNEVENRLKQLKGVYAYPIKNFTQDHYKSLKYIFLNCFVNSEFILMTMFSVKDKLIK
ncbi:glycosyltransferase [Sabulilitoribacter multivorans]|uniref:Glycosyltransferase n=1 Tax=Flaviramulus multivorans TaxID=1304750 RepID=A0ABS9IHD8_9FLAO|nr:glycosyltransferase family 2 protein [Flaviramulus multivorans]MCF7560040.1 glycosyltransferase [Flaviramulus multivorans]